MKNEWGVHVKQILIFLMGIVLSSGATVGWADDDTGVDETVVVTATRTPKDLKNVPVAVTVITREELQKRDVRTVADALRDVPGVELTDSAMAGGQRMIVRGESGNRVLVLIDGQKISEQKSVSGVPLLIDLNSVERIEVVKGPGSVLYGSDAIGGVINIITKQASDKRISTDLMVAYDSSTEGFDASLGINGTTNGFTYRVGHTRNNHNDRETPDGTVENTSFDFESTNVSLAYEANGKRVGVGFDNFEAYIEAFEEPVFPMVNFVMNLPEWSRKKTNAFFEGMGTGENLLKYRFDVYRQTTFKDLYNEMAFQMGPTVSTINIHTANDQDSTGGLIQLNWLFAGRHYVITGLDYQKDELFATEHIEMGGFAPVPIVTDNFYDTDMEVLALYVQDEWQISDKLAVTLGARSTAVDSRLNRTDNDVLELTDSSDSKLVANVAVVYAVSDAFTWRASASQGYRYPTLLQLFIGTSHGYSSVTMPNPDLKPETSDSFETGFRLFSDRTSLDVAAFYTTADNYITTALVEGVRAFHNFNEATTFGLELAWDFEFGSSGWGMYSSCTYLRRKFEELDSATYNTGHPKLTARIGFTFEKAFSESNRFWLDAYGRFASSAKEEFESMGTTSVLEYDAWKTVNCIAGYTFGTSGNYRISLAMNNILDERYRVATESLMSAGRHVVLKFSVTY